MTLAKSLIFSEPQHSLCKTQKLRPFTGLSERLDGKKSKDEKSACTLFGQWLRGKEPGCHAGDSGDMGSIPYQGVGKIPWRRKWQPTPVFLPGKSHGQRGLEGYSPWSHKELDMTEHELPNGVWHTVEINKGRLSCCSYGEELNWRESEQTATTIF